MFTGHIVGKNSGRAHWARPNLRRRSLAFDFVTGGYEPNDDDAPLSRPPGPDRSWQHPSEVGLAVRGRVDRRRSSVLATGLVLSGLGLLVTGVLMGQLPRTATPPEPTAIELAAPSLVAVTAVGPEGVSRHGTGVVLDDDGHLLLPSDGLGEDDDVWTRTTGGELRRGELVGVDEHVGIAVLRVRTGSSDEFGTVPRLGMLDRSEAVEVLHRVRKGVTASPGWVTPPPASSVALTAVTVSRPRPDDVRLRPADSDHVEAGPVFDDTGRLVALVTESGGPDATGTVPAVSAREALGAAADLIDG